MDFKIPVIVDSLWIETTGIPLVKSGHISKVDLLYSVKYVYLKDMAKLYVPVFTQFSKIIIPKSMLSINNNFKYWDMDFLNLSIKERTTMFRLSYCQSI